MKKLFLSFLVGIYFGVILVKSEVVSWFRIQQMFRFEEAHMYLIIGSAVVVGVTSVWLMKRLGVVSVEHEPIQYREKQWHPGLIYGGIAFGLGWAITGACPGPIYAQIGSGHWLALVTFGGAFLGVYLYGVVENYLPQSFGTGSVERSTASKSAV